MVIQSQNQKTIFHIVVACSLGTILEWYDFSLYAYLVSVLSKVFFPNNDYLTSIMMAYSVFTIGFVVRPLGAILFGHLGDRVGRKKTLMISIILMASTTCLIGLLPTYNQVGLLAPILLISLRVVQGLAIGGEAIGAGSFVIESIGSEKRGLLTSLVWASSGIGILLSAVVVSTTTNILTNDELHVWGWRIPFLLGALTGFLGYYLRKNTEESTFFKMIQKNNNIVKVPLMEAINKFKMEIFIASCLYILSAIITYLIFVYMPVYVSKVTEITFNTAMLVNTVMMAIMVILVPIFGYYSDIYGRKVILLASSLGLFIFAFPLYVFIEKGSLINLIIAQLVFAFLAAGFQGPVTSAVLEMFPSNVRYSAAAFGYNLSYSLFGGTTPLIAVYLMVKLDNNAAPCLYLICGAFIAMLAVINMRETFKLRLC